MDLKVSFYRQPLVKSEKILIVVSRFNQEMTSKLLDRTQKSLIKLGVLPDDIEVIIVPGAIEIPLVIAVMAEKNKHAAIIALGCVIRGETSHYDYVCHQVSHSCAQIMIKTKKPLIFGILTTENEEQAYDRLGGKHGHKGDEFAECAIEMIQVLNAIRKA